MNKLFLVFAALVALAMGWSEAQAADPRGMAMCPNGMTPVQLAPKVRAAVQKDPSGNAMIEDCNVTVNLLIEGFRGTPTDVPIAVPGPQGLADWMEKFARATVPKDGIFVADCVRDEVRKVGKKKRVVRVLIKACIPDRRLKEGESVWGPVVDGVVHGMMWDDCDNTGYAPVPIVVTARSNPDCLTVWAPVDAGDPIRALYADDKKLGNECHDLDVDGMQIGDAYPEECPMGKPYRVVLADGTVTTIVCTWDRNLVAASKKLGRPVQGQNVSFGIANPPQKGWARLRLPRAALNGMTMFCWGERGEISWGVTREDFDANGVARIPRHLVYKD